MRTSLLLLLAGFTAWTPNQGSAQAAQTVPCTVPVVASSAEEPWQQVSARGFTFCIPSSWRATAGNTVRGDGGRIRWGTGEPRPTEVATMTMSVPVGSLPQVPTLPGRHNRFSETIGGYVAEISDSEYEGRFYTGAQWPTPVRIYLQGESADPRVRDRQLEVYRTVRFTPQ
jgi:hypothetical protein